MMCILYSITITTTTTTIIIKVENRRLIGIHVLNNRTPAVMRDIEHFKKKEVVDKQKKNAESRAIEKVALVPGPHVGVKQEIQTKNENK